jgi:Spy/CpxP family protein refolding chaperone
MTRVVVIVCFAMAFVAGLLVGWQTRTQVAIDPERSSEPTTRSHRGPTGWLVRELSLNDQQREQLEKIWSETARHGGREREDRRKQLRRERDEAIAALVPPEHYGRYDQILQLYFEKLDAIDREMKEAFDAAVEKTKLTLTPQQRAKYDELLKRHRPPDRDGRDGDKAGAREQSSRRGDDPRVTPRPTTAPNGVAPH